MRSDGERRDTTSRYGLSCRLIAPPGAERASLPPSPSSDAADSSSAASSPLPRSKPKESGRLSSDIISRACRRLSDSGFWSLSKKSSILPPFLPSPPPPPPPPPGGGRSPKPPPTPSDRCRRVSGGGVRVHGACPQDDDDARGWAGTKARVGSQHVRAAAVTAALRRRPGRLLCLPIVAEPRGYEVEVEVKMCWHFCR